MKIIFFILTFFTVNCFAGINAKKIVIVPKAEMQKKIANIQKTYGTPTMKINANKILKIGVK